MNLSIGNKIALGFALALVALLLIGTTTKSNLVELQQDSGWVDHTLEVKQKLQAALSSVLQSESSSRGYQLLQDPDILQIGKNAGVDATNDLRALRLLTQDNSTQQARLDRLEPLVAMRLDALQKLDDLRVGNPAMDTQRSALVKEGENYMERVRALITEMSEEEDRLLKIRKETENESSWWTSSTIIYGTLLAFLMVGSAGFLITGSIIRPLRLLGIGAAKIGSGDYSHRVNVTSHDEVGQMARLFNQMADQVENREAVLTEQDWLKTALTRFATLFQGQRDPAVICRTLLSELATLIEARYSVLYVPVWTGQEIKLTLAGSYAIDQAPEEIAPGEGLVGQCFVEKKRIMPKDIPADYLRISSALGSAQPVTILVQPSLYENEVRAILELASFRPFTPIQLSLIDQLSESIGVVLNTIASGLRTEELLLQSQALSADLKTQQEELSVKNAQLETQTASLLHSETLLQEQQEELKQTNEELEQTNEELQQTNEEMEEKANLLNEQKKEAERINREIEAAREALEEKARQIAQTSKYKSEFLANMSHELRTPLNSLLILSKMLADNNEANLSEKQVKYAKTIYSSGNDLLELINEVLDLSKIESGAVDLDSTDTVFADVQQFVEQTFRHVAAEKKLEFEIHFDSGLPRAIHTDARRLQQILKNLLSNAFKFTEHGTVTLKVATVHEGWNRENKVLDLAESVIAFTVSDTGIGIPFEKQGIIFEAFQQADSGTSRKYGGTGLGLSISRQIATILGGAIDVKSDPGKGSSFTLYLPDRTPSSTSDDVHSSKPSRKTAPVRLAVSKAPEAPPAVEVEVDGIEDDRANLQPGDLILLIIEDDNNFARILMDFAREKHFKAVVARSVRQGVALAHQINPSAITLDLHLPDNDGWVVLDRLKHDPKTRHIPIHIISADEERERSLRLGAVSYFQKPVTKEILDEALNQTIDFINRPLKKLLIIEDDPVQRQSLVDLIGNGDVKSTAVGTAEEAFKALEENRFDCLVLDLGLPDMNGIQLIREIHQKYGHHAPPVIVYTGRELSRAEETELRLISDSIVIKNARSPERLLDETALFLHRVQTKLPEAKRRMIEQVQKNDSILTGRKVLVVDDDVRNIFAITSALEASQMEVSYAESGQASIDLLKAHPEIEVILMDVMMPEMDGFEAIRRIRQLDAFKKIPIISVTAKAMKGDREKCLEAGASDYITKPVDMDQLRSLLRVWLYR